MLEANISKMEEEFEKGIYTPNLNSYVMPKSYKITEEEIDDEIESDSSIPFLEKVRIMILNKQNEEELIKKGFINETEKKEKEKYEEKEVKNKKNKKKKKEGKEFKMITREKFLEGNKKFRASEKFEDDYKSEEKESTGNDSEENAFMNIVVFSKQRREKQNKI
jgi:hypothetical protein